MLRELPALISRHGNPVWRLAYGLWLLSPTGLHAQTAKPIATKTNFGKPAIIASAALKEFDSLAADRQKMIETALALAKDSPWLPYTVRGSLPSDGGFDCSGAMYYVMRKVGLDPPRTSTTQLQWLKQHGRLHRVPENNTDPKHASLMLLLPGDLLFWGRYGSDVSGEPAVITHVAMFLGTEKSDGLPVMINSTDGRSYRGTQANGYGVYDFRLPAIDAKVSFIGYGTPPGIALPSPMKDLPKKK